MTMVVFAALSVIGVIWAITAPTTRDDLTTDEFAQLVVPGFVP